MAAQSATTPARWRRPFITWLDGIERGWAIPLLIVWFVAAWFAFLILAHLGVDLHYDTLETWSVGRFFVLGTVFHPPLMGWAAGLWTMLFPLTDWSFQLLAMVNAGIALWAVDLITRHFVRGDKRAIVLMLLMLTPAYQFHAQRFNANSVLLAVWPLATYAFLRSWETRRIAWSAVAGAMAALAMLGKYYSAFLIASFVLSALVAPGRIAYFRSPAPWVSAAIGLVVLSPHLYWLATTGAAPLKYVAAQPGGAALPRAAGNAAMFVLGLAAALAPAALVWMLTAGRRLRGFAREMIDMSPSLHLLALILLFNLALPMLYTLIAGTKMPSLWSLQIIFLAPILVVCAARFEIERFFTVNLAVIVIAFAALAAVVAAPIYARSEVRDGNDRAFYSAAAREMTDRWHAAVGTPLTEVGGDTALGFGAAFYSADHPIYWHPSDRIYMRLPTPDEANQGLAWMCFAQDRTCGELLDRVASFSKRPSRVAFTVERTLWGKTARADIVGLMALPPVR